MTLISTSPTATKSRTAPERPSCIAAVHSRAICSAAALLSASQQAPLMAMCLVMELTEAPIEFFVPVGLAVAASAFVSSWLLRRLS